MDFYKGTIPILDYSVAACRDQFHPAGAAYGHNPAQVDHSMHAAPTDMALIPTSEWDARYDEQEARQSSLEHIYLQGDAGQPAFVNLDQNGDGYCWCYSVGQAMMLAALRDNNLDYRLNPHSVGAIIKHGADEGGWCGLSSKFVADNGMAEEGTGPGQWAKDSRNLKYDTPACREAMKRHVLGEVWRDLTRDVYDIQLTKQQYATALFLNQPCPSDFNFWGHSVVCLRWVRVEAGVWAPLILNSWLNWGRFGLAVLRGHFPDSALSIRTVRAA